MLSAFRQNDAFLSTVVSTRNLNNGRKYIRTISVFENEHGHFTHDGPHAKFEKRPKHTRPNSMFNLNFVIFSRWFPFFLFFRFNCTSIYLSFLTHVSIPFGTCRRALLRTTAVRFFFLDGSFVRAPRDRPLYEILKSDRKISEYVQLSTQDNAIFIRRPPSQMSKEIENVLEQTNLFL